MRRDHEWRMVAQQRGEETKKPALWVAGLMKPALLLCCLIVCKMKMELSSPIRDVSGDLIPQQLFGIQQGSSAFFLRAFFPLSLVICLPCWQELPVFCLYLPAKQTHPGPSTQELLKCGGRKKRDECRDTPRDLVWMFPRGATAKSWQLLLSHFSSSGLHFPLSYPHSEAPSQEKESGFWEWITFSTLLFMRLSFLFGNSARNHTYATENPTKSIYFKPRKRELKGKHFAGVQAQPFCWLLAMRTKKANGHNQPVKPSLHLLVGEATLLSRAVFLRLITFC